MVTPSPGGAVVSMLVADYYPKASAGAPAAREGWKAARYAGAPQAEDVCRQYLDAAGIRGQARSPSSARSIGKTGILTVCRCIVSSLAMIVGERPIQPPAQNHGCHTFPATGITGRPQPAGRLRSPGHGCA